MEEDQGQVYKNTTGLNILVLSYFVIMGVKTMACTCFACHYYEIGRYSVHLVQVF